MQSVDTTLSILAVLDPDWLASSQNVDDPTEPGHRACRDNIMKTDILSFTQVVFVLQQMDFLLHSPRS